MKRILKAKQIFTETGILEDAAVCIEGDRILSLQDADADETLDFGEAMIFPGLIDIHVHGGGGFDAMDGTAEAVCSLARFKALEGVTAFCPTTVTATMAHTKQALSAISEAKKLNTDGAQMLGVFCEGPYISTAYKGAHAAECIRDLDVDEIADLLDAGNGDIGSFALAPEKENADAVIEMLLSRGVHVRLGHSAATYAQTRHAVDLGARMFIHTFNAMSPVNHREVGMAGAALLDDRAFGELICDFIHVSPEAVRLAYRCKGADKIVLITDALKAAGLPDGPSVLGALDVIVKDGVCRLPDGTLAGSTLRLLDGVRNMASLGVPLTECVQMATTNPAKAVGIYHETGSIAPGKMADFTVVDGNFNILFVMSNGRVLVDKRRLAR